MEIQKGYNQWAPVYDSNKNRTRDLEGVALRKVLSNYRFISVLEIGCGTGKNTQWLANKAEHVTAIDFSSGMLSIAKSKVQAGNVIFKQADILNAWSFADSLYDLVSFSLVLEHIEDLNQVFQKASKVIVAGGYLYLGELHPFKQYSGTKARFANESDSQTLQCYNHHLSDFVRAAQSNGFTLKNVEEYFDEDDKSSIPRILVLVFKLG